MKIGIDVSSLVFDRGVSRYTANLVRSLVPQSSLKLYLYGTSLRQHQVLQNKAQELCLGHKNCQTHIQNLPPTLLDWLWRFRINSIGKIMPKVDLFHSWDWQQPPDKQIPLVSTVHDLAILKFPETAHPQIVKNHQRSWQILKERQAEVIAVSHATKKDLVELLDFDPNRVHVIYEALPTETEEANHEMSEDEYQNIKTYLKLDKPYLLFVGTREPRKNLDRLIKAWKPLASDYDLIIAGESGWGEKATAGPRFLGKVSEKELAVLYGEAQVFVFPSLYEGFGLPILESFYHGTPVVTSNVSAMPEVAGNAAELVEPKSVESIRQGIEIILNEKKAAQDQRLKRMIIRLHLFNWQKVAKQTISVYQKALAS